MADTKITALLTPQVTTNPATDVLPIVNIADTLMASSGSTRKITVNSLLGAGGTATLASATITGDLTVDTSTLKVDSTNDRVGIGTASPTSKLHILNTAAATRITITDDSANGRSGYIESNFSDALVIGTTSGVRAIRFSPDNKPYYQIAADGVQTWLDGIGGTRMTLNSTGLGVGTASPTAKLDVLGSGDGELRLRAGSDAALIFSETAANKNWKLKPSGGDFQFQYSATAYNSGYSPLMTLTATGNVLVGTASVNGSISNTSKLVAGIFSTVNGVTASIATATPTTIFAAPAESTFIVSAYLNGVGAPTTYNAVSIVKVSNNVAAITAISTATSMTITLSGSNVQVTQSSGGNQVVTYSVTRLY